MSRISREQFKNEFQNGIDIDSLSDGTSAALEDAGITKAKLAEIAQGDGKIKGAELNGLFNAMDSFDNGQLDGYLDTHIKIPQVADLPNRPPDLATPEGEAYLALKNEFNRNRSTSRLKGPQPSNSKTADSAGTPGQAKVIMRGLSTQFDFGRPITSEQAAKLIFKDGKVPDRAELVPGPGNNSWTVKTPDDDAKQEMVKHMRAHTETIDRSKPDQFTITWSDGPQKASSAPTRRDLNNDYGFKITKNYELDAGQHWSPGAGYELSFEKPMTKEQVMNTLFAKDKMPGKDGVKLIPVGHEPAQTWQVHLTVSGQVNLKPGISGIFGDSNVYSKESIRPDVPASMRTHLENHTIPSHAIAFPKGQSHPPGTYVWEQDGYLAYVITDGKGKSGFYESDVLKLNSNKGSQFNKDMRYYVIENGMPPNMAVAAFNQQWEELNRMMVTGFALALSSASPEGRNVSSELEQFEKGEMSRWRSMRTASREESAAGAEAKVVRDYPASPRLSSSEPRPTTEIGKADTAPQLPKTVESVSVRKPATDVGNAETQPGPGAAQSASRVRPADAEANISIQTSKGSEEMTVGEYQQRWKTADKWVKDEARKLQQRRNVPPPRELYKEAQDKFGLNDNWQYISNPYIHGKL